MIRCVIYMDEDLASCVIRCNELILIDLEILVEQHGGATVEVEGCRCHLSESTTKCRRILSNARTKEMGEGFDNEFCSLFIGFGSNAIDGFFRSVHFVGQTARSRITIFDVWWSRHVELL
jgi:hypothetical protein